MRPARWLGFWGRLFLAGLALAVVIWVAAFFLFPWGYGPDWLAWIWVGDLGLMVVAIFGWLATFDQRRRPTSN